MNMAQNGNKLQSLSMDILASGPSHFDGMSAREIYLLQCSHHKCRPNSRLKEKLSQEPDTFSATELDLSGNLLGSNGILPLLEIVRVSHRLRRLIIRDNYLDNGAVHQIALATRHHPSLAHIDLSHNPISWNAGMSLLDLVSHNHRLQTVALDGTHVKPSIVQLISHRISMNHSNSARRTEKSQHTILASSLPARLSGLKRVFNEIADQEGNPGRRVHKRNIESGYRENLRMQGREVEADLQPDSFWVELQERCNANVYGLIDWETFLLISMCEDVEFEPHDVARLKAQFEKYDVDKSGFIDLMELSDMMAEINGSTPSASEVQEKLKLYDVDDSNTLTWDEFCLMMYEWIQGAPSVGSHSRAPSSAIPHHPRYRGF